MGNELNTVALNLSVRRVAIPAPQGMWSIQYLNTTGLVLVDDGGNATAIGGGGGGSGTVTSVAASGLLTVTGSPTVTPMVAFAAMADQTIVGNVSGASAVPVALNQAAIRTFLALATVAISGSATDLSTGTLPAARFGPLTSDVTTSGYTATLANTAVTPGSYTNGNFTVDSKGRITAASNGSGSGITALTGDVTASGTGSVAAVVNSAASGFTVGTALNGQKTSFRNPDDLLGYAQLQFYPSAGTNITQNLAIIPRGTGNAGIVTQLQFFGTDLIGAGASYEYLNTRATGTSFNIYSTTGGASPTLRPLNFQVTGGGTQAADTGVTITATNNNLSLNSNYVATARAGTAVTAQANGTVLLLNTAPPTIANSASAVIDAIKVGRQTINFTGTTTVTTAAGVNFMVIGYPTLTATGATTINTYVSTLVVEGGPINGTNITISNAGYKTYALWLRDGSGSSGSASLRVDATIFADSFVSNPAFTNPMRFAVPTTNASLTFATGTAIDGSGGAAKMLLDTTGVSWFAAAAVAGTAQQTSGANLTNNVTSGGTTDTIANYTDLVIYANDAAAIRNDMYQIARKVKQLNDGLRSYGLFT